MREFVRHPNTHLILTRNSRKNITRNPVSATGGVLPSPAFNYRPLWAKHFFCPWVQTCFATE